MGVCEFYVYNLSQVYPYKLTIKVECHFYFFHSAPILATVSIPEVHDRILHFVIIFHLRLLSRKYEIRSYSLRSAGRFFDLTLKTGRFPSKEIIFTASSEDCG